MIGLSKLIPEFLPFNLSGRCTDQLPKADQSNPSGCLIKICKMQLLYDECYLTTYFQSILVSLRIKEMSKKFFLHL